MWYSPRNLVIFSEESLAQIKEKFVYLVKSRFVKRCEGVETAAKDEGDDVDPFLLPQIDLQSA